MSHNYGCWSQCFQSLIPILTRKLWEPNILPTYDLPTTLSRTECTSTNTHITCTFSRVGLWHPEGRKFCRSSIGIQRLPVSDVWHYWGKTLLDQMPLPVLLVSRMFNASIYTNDVSFNQNEIEDWTHTADVFFKETRMDVECEASLLFLPFFLSFF